MFSRSRNEDGTTNTRCLYCFMTIAADVRVEGEIERIEARHICPEKALAQLLTLKRTALVQTSANDK
jgi:hypothetical protein